MHSLWQDLRYALRLLRKNPVFALIAVLTLALGIGANTAMFALVNGVLLQPMPFPETNRLFLISFLPQNVPFFNAPGLLDQHYLEFREQDKLFEKVASFASEKATLTGAGDPVQLATAQVTADFFAVLRINAVNGRTFAADEEQPGRDRVLLISDKLWRNRLGADAHILGKQIMLDGIPRTVVGIMPSGFNFPFNADLWAPLNIHTDPRKSRLRPVVGRLRKGASQQQAQAELKALAPHFRQGPGEDVDVKQWRASIVPLKELLVRDIRSSLLIFAGAVGFVLLIACANVASLLLSRAAGRRQEMAMRAALGAGRGRLIQQMLTESILISLAGGISGVLLALWGVPALIALAPAGTLPRIEMIHIDGWVLAFTFGVSLITGVAFGLAPALHSTRQEVRDSLSYAGRTVTGGHERLRGSLVVSEFALALVLLTGAGLMVKSFLRLRAVNPGFEPSNVVTLTVDLPESKYRTAEQMQAFHDRLLSGLSALPGVVAAGAVNWRPLGGMLIMGDFQLEGGRTVPPGFMADKMCVSPGYLRAMGIRLLGGRDFTEADNASSPGAVIISQSVARELWPNDDPIGKRIAMEEHPTPRDWLTIVGIVDDVKQQGLALNSRPATYQPYRQVSQQFFINHMTFAVRTASEPMRVAAAMRAVLQQVDKDLPAESLASMQDLIAATVAEPRFQARLLGIFAVQALLLAVVGIYGVLAYSVAQRTREIGIRMALGARTGDVLGMVFRRTLVLAGLGVAIGAGGALILTRVLAKFLFQVKPSDPATFVAVAFALVSAALLAGWIPARRASRVDPMVALRYE